MLRYLVFGILGISVIVIVNGETSLVKDANYSYSPSQYWSDPFDWRLLKEFASEENNVLLSPIILRMMLALMYQGSNENTEGDFQNLLQFTNKTVVRNQYRDLPSMLQDFEGTGYILNIGSKIFLHSRLKVERKCANILKYFFETDIEPIDFSEVNSTKTINSWVGNFTKGKIIQLVQPEELKDVIMLITNAIYFKGTWWYQFSNNQSFYGNFHLTKENDVQLLLRTITVPYITVQESFYYYEENFNFKAKVLRLPYTGGRYSILIILPNSRRGLSALMKKIQLHNVKSLLYYMEKTTVKVTLPKFRFNYEKRMVPTLEKFGMHQVFDEIEVLPIASGWDYIFQKKVAKVDVIHKAGIEVEGVGAVPNAAVENKTEQAEAFFEANHPFLFFIEEDATKTILLAGKLENPLEESPVSLSQV